MYIKITLAYFYLKKIIYFNLKTYLFKLFNSFYSSNSDIYHSQYFMISSKILGRKWSKLNDLNKLDRKITKILKGLLIINN